MDDITFGEFWYPDFLGILYVVDPRDQSLIICPYFDDIKKAEHVSNEISKWNENFIKVRFIEYNQNEYSFVAYQDPQGSFDKLNFSIYRSSMNRQGNYSQFKNRLETESVRIGVFYSDNISDQSRYRPIGEFLKISDCKILSDTELSNYPLEEQAHRICRMKS